MYITNLYRGEDIFISIWNLHRSPNLWDDADKFIPDRWPLDGLNPNETNQNFCGVFDGWWDRLPKYVTKGHLLEVIEVTMRDFDELYLKNGFGLWRGLINLAGKGKRASVKKTFDERMSFIAAQALNAIYESKTAWILSKQLCKGHKN
ncbi:hypothetical protein POTOM_061740 [Populus tomentosa]|uniref:Uncharacterized protein n=1 Tax=Populus tomentosa TaxID=118781 RepID=A0A8X8BY65_POPTO|nr:hypothetical protein POTOM_061740 [Populus tomentosa]